MSSVASSRTTSTTSSTVTMPFMCPSASTTGSATRWLWLNWWLTVSWSICSGMVATCRFMISATRVRTVAVNSSRNETTPRRCCSVSSTYP